jgi:MATE family multidrug resistance protein
MRLQIMGLALKLPLTLLLVAGLQGPLDLVQTLLSPGAGHPGGGLVAGRGPGIDAGIDAGPSATAGAAAGVAWGAGPGGLGVAGCGLATACAMGLQMLLGLRALRRDAVFAPFGLRRQLWSRPNGAMLRAHLRLGLAMGLSVAVEVSGFTFMALFIARLGPAASAAHQVCANVVSLLFMGSLGVANACGALVAQALGAGDRVAARRLGWHGLLLGGALAALLGGVVTLGRDAVARLYASDAAIIASTAPLLAWVFVFHVADAVQTVAAFVLRAWQVALWPLLVYAGAVWGLGLGGGFALAFGVLPLGPGLQGPAGFWAGASLGLCAAGVALTGLLSRLSVPVRSG